MDFVCEAGALPSFGSNHCANTDLCTEFRRVRLGIVEPSTALTIATSLDHLFAARTNTLSHRIV